MLIGWRERRRRVLSCALFGIVISWILERKVGSRALDFVFRLYFQLVYHVFYVSLMFAHSP